MSITPEQWQRAKELFHKVQDLSSAERSVFLAKHCPDDAEVRAKVDYLAASYATVDPDFLEATRRQLVGRDVGPAGVIYGV